MSKQSTFISVSILVSAVAVSTVPAQAAIMSFTDRTAFENAVTNPLTTIDFESFPNSQPITPPTVVSGNEFAPLGVNLSASGVLGIVSTGFSNFLSPNIDSGAGAINVGQIEVDFLSPTLAVGADFFDVDLNISSVSLFDVNNDLIDTVPVPVFGNLTTGFLGITSTDPIGRAIFDIGLAAGSSTTDGIVIDNLTFEATRSVPEPFTLWGASVVFGLGILSKRRRQQ